jgi:RNA polymerase sigma-70 factor (ECF subfamily)
LARERNARLSVCLARHSGKTCEIFLAHRVEGLSYKEIADRHQVSISTIEKHVAKALLQVTGWMEGW